MSEKYRIAAEKAIREILKIRKDDTVIFPVFTDLHIHSIEEPAVSEMLDAMETLSDRLSPNGVIALGDNLGMLGRERQASNEEISDLIRNLLARVNAQWKCPVFPVNGNHDGWGTDFFDPEFWYSMTGSVYDKGQAVRDPAQPHSAYYFIDYPDPKLRVIVLSLPSGSNLTEKDPFPIWAYGKEQLQWLAEVALDTDFSVLLITHVPLYYECPRNIPQKLRVFTGEKITETPIANLCGWIEDRELAEAVFRAFSEHKGYENEEYGIHLNPSSDSAALIGCISGHMHRDSTWQAEEEKISPAEELDTGGRNPLPCIQFVIGSSAIALNYDYARTAELPLCMDIVLITPSEHRIDLIRYGEGSSRSGQW